jgi:hypothetical protein
MAQEGSLAQVRQTNQAGVGHTAWVESHLDLEDLHDPIHQEGRGDRTVDIVGDDRKEVRLEAKGLVRLVAEGQKEDLVVDVAEELGHEVEDEIRSVCSS